MLQKILADVQLQDTAEDLDDRCFHCPRPGATTRTPDQLALPPPDPDPRPPACRVPELKTHAAARSLLSCRFSGFHFVGRGAGARGSGLDLRVLYRAPHVTGRSLAPAPPLPPSSRKATATRRAGSGVPGQPSNPPSPPPQKARQRAGGKG